MSTNNEPVKQDTQENVPARLSTGAGIAIAGIWLASMVLTLAGFTFFFVWPDPIGANGEKAEGGAVLFAMLVTALPMILAWSMTKKLIGK